MDLCYKDEYSRHQLFCPKGRAYQCHEQLYRRALNYLTRDWLSIGSIYTGIAPLVIFRLSALERIERGESVGWDLDLTSYTKRRISESLFSQLKAFRPGLLGFVG